MGSMSLMHWIVVLVIVLLLFGTGRISGVMQELGKGVRGFKEGLNGKDDDKNADTKIPPPGA